ncbi:MAG: aromatic ring-hydroxylating oxygenase subunit alpha [Alphaproteobacteria bacterium]
MDVQEKDVKHVEAPSGVPMGREATADDLAARQNGGDVMPSVEPPARLETSIRGTPADKAPDPGLTYDTIPKARYTDERYVGLEWERLWTKVWNLAGRVDDLAEPGDYFTYDLGKESFIITRDRTMNIRAYYNVCLHRGNRLKPERGVGFSDSFQCMYHHWEWNLDGTIKRIPDEETFPQGLDHDCLKLKEVKVDIWGGFVFINMNPDAEPLTEFLGVIPEHLDPYHFQDMVLVSDQTVEWDCNWKTSLDAFNESYHVQGIHPQLMSWLDDYYIQWDVYGKHTRMLVPMGVPSPRYKNQDSPASDLEEFIEQAGLNPDDFKGKVREARLEIQKHRRSLENETYLPYKHLNDDQLSDDYHYTVFPNWTMNIYADAMMLFLSRPHPTDPNKMFWDLQFYMHVDPAQPKPDRPERTQHKYDEVDLGEVLNQDAYNLPHVQAGMNSDAYEGLILSEQEVRILAFHKTWEDYVEPDQTAQKNKQAAE